jgi:transposase
MFIDQCTYQNKGGTYTRVLLRHGYREEGKVKLKTIANLSHCSPEEIEALRIALKKKDDIPALKKMSEGVIENGKYIGSLCVLDQISREIGITKCLGDSPQAKRILWLIFARLLEQGSRLSATRLAQNYAIGELMGIEGFCEDDLYEDLDWLFKRKEKIEQALFKHATEKKGQTPTLFLYDVSSSYFEGEQNELAEYGYSRDKKKGKKQIVYGVLTDQEGDPVSIEAFSGNTSDTTTFISQIEKIKNIY